MWYQRTVDSITVYVYVQPGAKTTEVVGLYDGLLKIRLNTPPIEGRANAALKKYMAELFAVPLRQVQSLSGGKNRRKIIKVSGSVVDPVTICSD